MATGRAKGPQQHGDLGTFFINHALSLSAFAINAAQLSKIIAFRTTVHCIKSKSNNNAMINMKQNAGSVNAQHIWVDFRAICLQPPAHMECVKCPKASWGYAKSLSARVPSRWKLYLWPKVNTWPFLIEVFKFNSVTAFLLARENKIWYLSFWVPTPEVLEAKAERSVRMWLSYESFSAYLRRSWHNSNESELISCGNKKKAGLIRSFC